MVYWIISSFYVSFDDSYIARDTLFRRFILINSLVHVILLT